MCPLHPEPPSHLPHHPIPLCCPRAPALGALNHTPNLYWSSVLHMVTYMFQCYSLKSSHPLLLPLRSAFETVFGNAFLLLGYLFLAVLGLPCCAGFSPVAASRVALWLQCTGSSLQWLLLLHSMSSRAHGLQHL